VEQTQCLIPNAPIPSKRAAIGWPLAGKDAPMRDYAELAVATNFSFLRGASHPEELVERATQLQLSGIGIADRNTLAGVVRAHLAAHETPLRLAIGVRLVFNDGTPDVLVYPQNRTAYGRLCRLLTTGNRRTQKGECILTLEDLCEHISDMCCIVIPPPQINAGFTSVLTHLAKIASNRVWLAGSILYHADDRRRLMRLSQLARAASVPLIAVGDVFYHVPERRALQDVLICIREHQTLETAGRLLEANAERHLKSPQEMFRLFRDFPEAITETVRFLSHLSFSLNQLRYEYPDEVHDGFATAGEALQTLTWKGAAQRYPNGVPETVRKALHHELNIIADLAYEPYFLTVYDIVRFARMRQILCQGRGSAANSAVCFCLGITEVDPKRGDLLFERFISSERREPPDIDVDFEHERREEVIQYIYQRYGRERSGIAATVICYRARSAIREVSKAFGLSEDTASALSGTIWGWSSKSVTAEQAERVGLDPSDPRLTKALLIARELVGFPRHLSQHVGGFVLTRGRLDETVPIGNAAMEERTFIEWDKDDLNALGILKIDVLALGMLTCIRKALDLIALHYDQHLTIASIPAEDPAVYRMIQRADTIGIFQIESRAQMTMLPRLKPKKFYDLVIEVAIVRPGPIQGDMVHPYLRRRQGQENISYPSPAPGHGPADELEQVLGKTLGVPLFQEQAMRIAIVAAGFAPTEADKLRRAMATFRRVGTIGTFQRKMIDGMVRRGYDESFADRCFRQIEGFGEYGFPESHAASFALLVYASAWLKCRYPDAFAAALLNAQPMGFYAPSQIVRDAQEHGIEVRPVDINLSRWDNHLETQETGGKSLHPRHSDMAQDIQSRCAVRLGFRQISGFREDDARELMAHRQNGFDSLRDLWLRTGLSPQIIERLAEADAFRSIGLDRREALWAVRGLRKTGDKDDLPLFALADNQELEPDAKLPAMPLGEHVVEDYRNLRLSLKGHPVSFVRAHLKQLGIVANQTLTTLPTGRSATVAGLVIVRQRPGSAKGVIFMTLEDETAIANIIVWPKTFEKFRSIVLGGRLISVHGRMQNESGVIHIVADTIEDRTPYLALLAKAGPTVETLLKTDEIKHPVPDSARRSPSRHRRRSDDETARIADLDIPAHASRHAPSRRLGTNALPRGRNFR
jgi:error-prone DNA polymerase